MTLTFPLAIHLLIVTGSLCNVYATIVAGREEKKKKKLMGTCLTEWINWNDGMGFIGGSHTYTDHLKLVLHIAIKLICVFRANPSQAKYEYLHKRVRELEKDIHTRTPHTHTKTHWLLWLTYGFYIIRFPSLPCTARCKV